MKAQIEIPMTEVRTHSECKMALYLTEEDLVKTKNFISRLVYQKFMNNKTNTSVLPLLNAIIKEAEKKTI
jgi:hypothetical protein